MKDISACSPNKGKNLVIHTPDYGCFARYPVKTHVIALNEELTTLMDKYIVGNVKANDYVFISEKIVAICQGRAFPIEEIRPRPLAKILSKFVYPSPYGIGLGSPWTMELALQDIRPPRILFAAFCSAVTKALGIRGVFYRIAGSKARAIDGPCDYTIPPYNHFAKMAPVHPNQVAERLAEHIGCRVVIIDANDIGVEVLGRSSSRINNDFCCQVFRDNPLCQEDESTPMAIVRAV